MSSSARNELETIWEVPDALWERFVAPALHEFDPAPKTGRPRADQRRCLDGSIYRARTGCQWNHLPGKFGSGATIHRTLQRWERLGIFDKLGALLIYRCEDSQAVHWEWQAADGMLNKARFIGDGQKGGIKRVGLEKVDETTGEKKHPRRRWVVERTFSWLQRWRGILNRWEKKPAYYLASLKL